MEFVEARGSVISVRLDPKLGNVNRSNAVTVAKRLLEQLVATNALPEMIHDGKNQDGRSATIAEDLG